MLAGQCKANNQYHIFSEYGILELDETTGEIIGTGFLNYAMPLIRYRTGDIGKIANNTCVCGRNYLLLDEVKGRVQEFVVAKDSHLIPLGDLQIPFIFDNVRRFQFQQNEVGIVRLRIIPGRDYKETDTCRILHALHDRLGDNVDSIHIEFVKSIPTSESGKYNFVIQNLPIGRV